MTARATFDVHGVGVQITADDPASLAPLALDFAWFRAPLTGPADVSLHLPAGPGPAAPRWGVPVGRRARVWDQGPIRWVDYHGRALLRRELNVEAATLWATDADVRWEAGYLFLMSRVGEQLDRRGVHRLHALGLARSGRAALVMLRSGGGKSTLGLGALARTTLGFLSDDLQLLTPTGDLLAFPNRIGCLEPPPGVNPAHVRLFRRLEHGDKLLVDVAPFAHRVVRRARPVALFVGHRTAAPGFELRRAAPHDAARALLSEVVVGHGLPQAIEHVLRPDPADLARRAQIAASRAAAALRLLGEVEVFQMRLGGDREVNLEGFLTAVQDRI